MDTHEKTGGHITKFEWFFLIGAMLVIDVIALILDFFVVGAAINRIIDILCALFVIAYVKIRGAYMDTRAWLSIGAVFAGEMIPVIDALPLWTLDMIYLWSINSSGATALAASQALSGGMKGNMGGEMGGMTPPRIPEQRPKLPRRIPAEPGIGDVGENKPLVPKQRLPQTSSPGIRDVGERAKKLDKHADEYRKSIESKTSSYGEAVRRGQEYIQNSVPVQENQG